jgi:c-di-GMP-binding flagellar brake protein YcgR
MSGKGRADQRRQRRYPFACEVRAQDLPLYGLSKAHRGLIRGTVQDISSGGLSLLGNHAVKPSSLVRCEIRFSELPVRIPVLSQVRWVQKDPGGRKYRIGLQYVL